MTTTIAACPDLRSPCTFVAKAEVYRWEEDFGVGGSVILPGSAAECRGHERDAAATALP